MKSTATILKKIMDSPNHKTIFNRINPILFDVSLRDGIQNAKLENFPTSRKMELFHSILTDLQPKKLEIGSLTSPKILPIMEDSLVLHNYAVNYLNIQKKKPIIENPDLYLLIPSEKKMLPAIEHGITNFSFITSVSDQFQIRNTNKTIQETKYEFDVLFNKWFKAPCKFNKKLYISCINKCPILGKINNDFVLKEVLYYHEKYDFDEVCLSDTTGYLDYNDFEYIVENTLYFGVPPSKLSFHFHCPKNKYENIEKILFYCFSKKLNKFDVSMLETGGCSITMDSTSLKPNLSYDLFYSILDKYINRCIAFEELYE
jgi:hydroxymethylglutaryl-CoA lyase